MSAGAMDLRLFGSIWSEILNPSNYWKIVVNVNVNGDAGKELRAEGRGAFRCPRMIDCSKVCNGFPNCCVNGQCICQACLPPADPNFNFNLH